MYVCVVCVCVVCVCVCVCARACVWGVVVGLNECVGEWWERE